MSDSTLGALIGIAAWAIVLLAVLISTKATD